VTALLAFGLFADTATLVTYALEDRSRNGTIGVTWLDRSLDAANVNYDAFGAAAKRITTLKNANLRLSTASSNPFNDGFGSGFMGDFVVGHAQRHRHPG